MFPQPVTNFTAQTKAYTANPGDTVLVTTGEKTKIKVTLPPVASKGPVNVRRVDSAAEGVVEVVTADESKIDGITGTTGVKIETQHTGFTLASDGTEWHVIGQ